MNEILKPGDLLIIAVQVPEDYEIEEYHQELMFEDFMNTPRGFTAEIHGIFRKDDK